MSFNSDADVMGLNFDNQELDMAEMSKYMLNPKTYPSFEKEYSTIKGLDHIQYSAYDNEDVRLDGLNNQNMPLHPDHKSKYLNEKDYVVQSARDKHNASINNRKTIEDYFMENQDVHLQNDSKMKIEPNIVITKPPLGNTREHLDNADTKGDTLGYLFAKCEKHAVSMLIAIIFILIVAMIVMQILHTKKIHKMVKMMIKALSESNKSKLSKV